MKNLTIREKILISGACSLSGTAMSGVTSWMCTGSNGAGTHVACTGASGSLASGDLFYCYNEVTYTSIALMVAATSVINTGFCVSGDKLSFQTIQSGSGTQFVDGAGQCDGAGSGTSACDNWITCT